MIKKLNRKAKHLLSVSSYSGLARVYHASSSHKNPTPTPHVSNSHQNWVWNHAQPTIEFMDQIPIRKRSLTLPNTVRRKSNGFSSFMLTDAKTFLESTGRNFNFPPDASGKVYIFIQFRKPKYLIAENNHCRGVKVSWRHKQRNSFQFSRLKLEFLFFWKNKSW